MQLPVESRGGAARRSSSSSPRCCSSRRGSAAVAASRRRRPPPVRFSSRPPSSPAVFVPVRAARPRVRCGPAAARRILHRPPSRPSFTGDAACLPPRLVPPRRCDSVGRGSRRRAALLAELRLVVRRPSVTSSCPASCACARCCSIPCRRSACKSAAADMLLPIPSGDFFRPLLLSSLPSVTSFAVASCYSFGRKQRK